LTTGGRNLKSERIRRKDKGKLELRGQNISTGAKNKVK
jgi:hypothetical protein